MFLESSGIADLLQIIVIRDRSRVKRTSRRTVGRITPLSKTSSTHHSGSSGALSRGQTRRETRRHISPTDDDYPKRAQANLMREVFRFVTRCMPHKAIWRATPKYVLGRRSSSGKTESRAPHHSQDVEAMGTHRRPQFVVVFRSSTRVRHGRTGLERPLCVERTKFRC